MQNAGSLETKMRKQKIYNWIKPVSSFTNASEIHKFYSERKKSQSSKFVRQKTTRKLTDRTGKKFLRFKLSERLWQLQSTSLKEQFGRKSPVLEQFKKNHSFQQLCAKKTSDFEQKRFGKIVKIAFHLSGGTLFEFFSGKESNYPFSFWTLSFNFTFPEETFGPKKRGHICS